MSNRIGVFYELELVMALPLHLVGPIVIGVVAGIVLVGGTMCVIKKWTIAGGEN
ncbi:MAG: hypothetical protein ACTSYQ_04515 [Candidatus Odinarchaeia archaeon]